MKKFIVEHETPNLLRYIGPFNSRDEALSWIVTNSGTYSVETECYLILELQDPIVPEQTN
jgi:hypothetical protein